MKKKAIAKPRASAPSRQDVGAGNDSGPTGLMLSKEHQDRAAIRNALLAAKYEIESLRRDGAVNQAIVNTISLFGTVLHIRIEQPPQGASPDVVDKINSALMRVGPSI